MSTQPIEHKGYGYTLKQPRRHREDVDFPLGPETSKKQQETVAGPGSGVRDRIRELLSDIPMHGDNRLSFKDVVDYRDVLEKDWDAALAGDLAALGVDMTRKFRLSFDPASQTVSAGNDHPDKSKINQYFLSKRDMADDFDRILQLGKLSDVAERSLSPEQMDQTLDVEAMSWWYQTNMDTTSLFSGGGVVFGMGSSAYKGLDIVV